MTQVQPLAAGEEGEQVEELQRRLRHLGHYEGEIDGRYSDETEKAVREFQSRSGNAEDGRMEPETWEVLERETMFAGYDPYAAQSQQPHNQSQADDQQDDTDTGEGQSSGYSQLSEDGHYRWDGTDWQPVAGQGPTAGVAQSTMDGQLSEDGHYRWDGTDWQPVAGQGPAAGEADQPSQDAPDGPLSLDGKWRWDGTDWQPVTGQAVPTGDHDDHSTDAQQKKPEPAAKKGSRKVDVTLVITDPFGQVIEGYEFTATFKDQTGHVTSQDGEHSTTERGSLVYRDVPLMPQGIVRVVGAPVEGGPADGGPLLEGQMTKPYKLSPKATSMYVKVEQTTVGEETITAANHKEVNAKLKQEGKIGVKFMEIGAEYAEGKEKDEKTGESKTLQYKVTLGSTALSVEQTG